MMQNSFLRMIIFDLQYARDMTKNRLRGAVKVELSYARAVVRNCLIAAQIFELWPAPLGGKNSFHDTHEL